MRANPLTSFLWNAPTDHDSSRPGSDPVIFRVRRHSPRRTKWHLSEQQGISQTYMTKLVQGVKQRRAVSVHSPLSPLHPWQSDPPFPNHVAIMAIDLSHHHPKHMHCQQDWEVMQRNGRVWIARKGMCPVSLDAAQYGMLINLQSKLGNDGPSEDILHQLTVTCLAQRQADLQLTCNIMSSGAFIYWPVCKEALVRPC